MQRNNLLRGATLLAGVLALSGSLNAQVVWDGEAGDGVLNTPTNWVGDVAPVAGDTATFDGTEAGPLALSYNANIGGSTGLSIDILGTQADSVSIVNDGADFIRIAPSGFLAVRSGAGSFTFGNGGDPGRVVLGFGASPASYVFRNDSANPATIGSDITWINGGGHTATAIFRGTGEWFVEGPITKGAGGSEVNVYKEEDGTLTLSGPSRQEALPYAGLTRLSQGTLIVASDDALGTSTLEFRHIVGTDTSVFRSDGNARTIPNDVVVAVTAGISSGLNQCALGAPGTGNLTFTGQVNWGGGTKKVAADGTTVTFTGPFIGNANNIATDANWLYGSGIGNSVFVLDGDRGTAAKFIDVRSDVTVQLVSDTGAGSPGATGIRVRGADDNGVLELAGGITVAAPIRLQGRTLDTNFAPSIRNLSGDNTIPVLNIDAGGSEYNIDSAAGTLTITNANSLISSGQRDFNFTGAGNVIIDSGLNIFDGGVEKDGSGTVTLGGTSAYVGATNVNAGTLVINGDASGVTGNVTVAGGATLAGTGTIGGAVTVNGTVAPGASIGTLSLAGGATLAGSYAAEIDRAAGQNADLLDVTGTITVGGDLDVTNIGGALQLGDSFDLIDATTISGTFANVNLPTLGSGLAWDTSALYTTGVITVTGSASVTDWYLAD